MSKRISVSVALAVTLIAMTVTFAITMLVSMDYFNNAVREVTQMQAQYSKLADLDSYVRGNYYGDIDDSQLNDRLATGYLAGIGDKYSTYYSEKEFAELQEYEQGTRVDIGVALVLDADGYFRIARVFPNSPAATAGLQENERILTVDGTDARTITSTGAMNALLRGTQGTELALTCLQGTTDEVSYTVNRSAYTLPTVEYLKSGDFGYFRIYSFEERTFAEFERYVAQATADEVEGLVFDLRGNAGNNFQSVYNILNMVCPRGTIAKSESKNGTVRVLATSDEYSLGKPMAVLVDGGTAASAELFAEAVHDLAGGRIVGVSTAGKWMLQSSPQRLPDGSAVSITTARLLSGEDENYEGTGLTPDIGLEALQADDSALLWNPSPETDAWILRALEVVLNLATTGNSGSDTSSSSSSSASTSDASLAPDASGSDASTPDSTPPDDTTSSEAEPIG